MRALHGLWQSGGGEISRLQDSRVLFFPQKPYLPLIANGKNDLCAQLRFPLQKESIVSKQAAKHALKRVNLKHIWNYQTPDNRYGISIDTQILCDNDMLR